MLEKNEEYLEDEYSRPDAALTVISREQALRLFDEGKQIYLIRISPWPVLVTGREEIERGSDYFQIAKEDLEKDKQKTMENGEKAPVEKLAVDLDDFAFDFDFYHYKDSVEDREQAVEALKEQIQAGDKSKKNNNDRTQYRQKNHHEAIVSREVFNAANHLRASRNYSKKNRPLPVLSVVEDGILRGYVPFDKDWTGFSAEEYREASESVMKEPDVTVTADVKKRLDLTGYEIVRVQYFSTMQNPAMTISNGRLRFNTACLKKFENVEYVELLLNSVERCIAIRPCDKNNPNAIRWGRLKEGRWCASTLGCRGLAKTLFDIMEWDEDLRYRFRGQFLEQGDNKMMLFAFDEPEMIKVEEIVLPPKENTEEDEGETVKKKIYIFPPEWAGTFGQPITSIAQVGILRQEHYAGNWDVFRPATEIEEMNIFTAESLNELLREAEKIMEGWTDYR